MERVGYDFPVFLPSLYKFILNIVLRNPAISQKSLVCCPTRTLEVLPGQNPSMNTNHE
jgi:hypothetical protein